MDFDLVNRVTDDNARKQYLANETENLKDQLQSDVEKYSSFKGKNSTFGQKKKKPATKPEKKSTGLTEE